jgi:hypothetical protein
LEIISSGDFSPVVREVCGRFDEWGKGGKVKHKNPWKMGGMMCSRAQISRTMGEIEKD